MTYLYDMPWQENPTHNSAFIRHYQKKTNTIEYIYIHAYTCGTSQTGCV